MSKFDFESFSGDYDFAVSKEKYTKERATELYKEEWGFTWDEKVTIITKDAHVRHRAGRNEDGECCVGWWLEFNDKGRSCPVWAFRLEKAKEGENGLIDAYKQEANSDG